MKIKKIIAGLSAMAMVSMMFVGNVNAANIVATGALDGTVAVGETITVTSLGGDYFTDDNEITVATIKNLDGTATASGTTLTVGGANSNSGTSVLTIANGDLVDNTTYIVTFNTANGDTGAFQMTVGTPTDNQIIVTAIVEPILKMAFSNTAFDLGVLSTVVDTYTNVATVGITTATNAQGGLFVTMTSNGLKDTTINKEIGVADIDTSVNNTNATDYYKVQSNALGETGALVDTNGDSIFAAAGTDMLATQDVVPNIGVYAAPHNDTITIVSVSARADSKTEAGNYSDILTFTVTGNF